jgi:hypothetical protein
MAYETRDQGLLEGLGTVGKAVLPFTFTSGKKGATEAISGFAGLPITGTGDGKLGGSGPLANWERIKKRLEKKLGLKINDKEDEE